MQEMELKNEKLLADEGILSPQKVLSSIFRKFVSVKNEVMCRSSAMERLRSAYLIASICRRRCQGRRSRSSRPLTPTATDAI